MAISFHYQFSSYCNHCESAELPVVNIFRVHVLAGWLNWIVSSKIQVFEHIEMDLADSGRDEFS